MSEAVIVAAARTPIGRAYKGSLVDVSAFRLAEIAIREVVARSGIDHADIDDIVLGESLYGGGDIARHTAVVLGLTNVPGLADNRHCASGLSALQIAAGASAPVWTTSSSPVGRRAPARCRRPGWCCSRGASPRAGSHHRTRTPPKLRTATCRSPSVRTRRARWASPGATSTSGPPTASSRRSSRSTPARSRRRSSPVEYTDREGNQHVFSVDEHPRRGFTVDTLADLKPLHPELESPTITAGNASGINDAAAAVVITARDYADAHGLTPLARIVSWANFGSRPRAHRHGPDSRDPEGTRARRADRFATSICSRSTRRSARCRWRRSASWVSTRRR